MTDEAAPVVTRNDEGHRYELHLGDTLAGFTEFFADDRGRLVFPHTEIAQEFGGRGLGKVLVAAAMADLAERGETVVPICPFVVHYLERHEVPGLDIARRTSGGGRGGEPGGGRGDDPDAVRADAAG